MVCWSADCCLLVVDWSFNGWILNGWLCVNWLLIGYLVGGLIDAWLLID